MEAAVYEPISPELVLVSPPDLAIRARALLPDATVPRWLPLAAPHRAAVSPARLTLETLGFAVFCLLATVGPMVLVMLART